MCQWKKSSIQSESVSPLDDGVRLAVLNLLPSIVMRETDLQLSLAGARRWRQGRALDLWLSLAPVKEPLNCSTVELCPPRITLRSAKFTFYHPTGRVLVLLLHIGGFRARKPGTTIVCCCLYHCSIARTLTINVLYSSNFYHLPCDTPLTVLYDSTLVQFRIYFPPSAFKTTSERLPTSCLLPSRC